MFVVAVIFLVLLWYLFFLTFDESFAFGVFVSLSYHKVYLLLSF